MSNARHYFDLKVWQLAERVFEMVCEDVKSFPKNKVAWIIEDQLVRAAGSIGANIAEGFDRKTKNDMIRFSIIARSSAAETEVWVLRTEKQKFISAERKQKYFAKLIGIRKMINSFNYKLKMSLSYPRT
ncbi:MAG: four helix bundle protein [Patescibacteria group bacterium]